MLEEKSISNNISLPSSCGSDEALGLTILLPNDDVRDKVPVMTFLSPFCLHEVPVLTSCISKSKNKKPQCFPCGLLHCSANNEAPALPTFASTTIMPEVKSNAQLVSCIVVLAMKLHFPSKSPPLPPPPPIPSKVQMLSLSPALLC